MNKLRLIFRPLQKERFLLNGAIIERGVDYLIALDHVSHDHSLRINNLFILVTESNIGDTNRLTTDSPCLRLYRKKELLKASHKMNLAGIYEIHFISGGVDISYLGEEKA